MTTALASGSWAEPGRVAGSGHLGKRAAALRAPPGQGLDLGLEVPTVPSARLSGLSLQTRSAWGSATVGQPTSRVYDHPGRLRDAVGAGYGGDAAGAV